MTINIAFVMIRGIPKEGWKRKATFAGGKLYIRDDQRNP